MNAKLKEIEDQIDDLKQKIYDKRKLARNIKIELMKSLFPDVDSGDLAFGDYWDCPESPTDRCVYNRKNDPCWDHCLICGDPHERK